MAVSSALFEDLLQQLREQHLRELADAHWDQVVVAHTQSADCAVAGAAERSWTAPISLVRQKLGSPKTSGLLSPRQCRGSRQSSMVVSQAHGHTASRSETASDDFQPVDAISPETREALLASNTSRTSAVSSTGFILKPAWKQEPLGEERAQWCEDAHVQMAKAFEESKTERDAIRKQSSSVVFQELTSSLSKYGREACKFRYWKHQLQNPQSYGHLFWDSLGIIFIAYDMITIPFYHAFEIDKTSFSETMDWFTLSFWTADIVLSFCTGFYKQGRLIRRARPIAMRYIRTWFAADVCIVVPEWWVQLSPGGENADIAGLGRVFRGTRAIRVLRLLRVLKLQRIRDRFYDSIETEWGFIISILVRLLAFILLLNHMVACCWYFIGKSVRDQGQPSWIDAADISHESLDYQYTTSLHWSLTQFTPASMDVSARNVPERIFSIVVLFFAMVVFSSVVASITSSMTSLRNISGHRMQEFWRLRKYMRQREISKPLQQRILKFLEFQCDQREKLVQASSITILVLLSEPLQNALANETHSKYLSVHDFFKYLEVEMDVVVHWICKAAVDLEVYAPGDVLFRCGDEAKAMRFVLEGNLEYQGEHMLNRTIRPKEWSSEATLWTYWRHMGKFMALLPSELLSLSPARFSEVMRMHPRPWFFARSYAKKYIELLNEHSPMLSDVMPCSYDAFYARAVEESANGDQFITPAKKYASRDNSPRTSRRSEDSSTVGPRISEIYRRSNAWVGTRAWETYSLGSDALPGFACPDEGKTEKDKECSFLEV